MPIADTVLAGLILFFAYFIRGIAGFGSGLIAVPLLALFQPLTLVVPVLLLLDLTASIWLGGRDRQHVQWDEVLVLIPPTLIGVVLGTTFLVTAPRIPILILLGVYIVASGVRTLLQHLDHGTPIPRWWAIPTGILGGTVSGLFGTGGPPYVVYATHRLKDKVRIRATLSAIFTIEGSMRLIAGLLAGLLMDTHIWWSVTAGLPILFLGLYLGGKVHRGIDNQTLIRLIGMLLMAAGLAVLGKAILA